MEESPPTPSHPRDRTSALERPASRSAPSTLARAAAGLSMHAGQSTPLSRGLRTRATGPYQARGRARSTPARRVTHPSLRRNTKHYLAGTGRHSRLHGLVLAGRAWSSLASFAQCCLSRRLTVACVSPVLAQDLPPLSPAASPARRCVHACARAHTLVAVEGEVRELCTILRAADVNTAAWAEKCQNCRDVKPTATCGIDPSGPIPASQRGLCNATETGQ